MEGPNEGLCMYNGEGKRGDGRGVEVEIQREQQIRNENKREK